jgi:hypothetical protein
MLAGLLNKAGIFVSRLFDSGNSSGDLGKVVTSGDKLVTKRDVEMLTKGHLQHN